MIIIIIIVVLFMSCFLTYIVRRYAIKKAIIDVPNQRSSHTKPTPRGGGLAIVIAWYIGIIFLFWQKQISTDLFYALIPGIILVIVGLIDDIYDLKPIIRITAQFFSAGLALYFIGGATIIDFGFVKIESTWLLTPLAFLGIIWFINLFNFLDGIDGYAGMEAVFISLALYFFTSQNYYLILVAAILGFLIWNWQPAKIFMGDVGSTLLGFNFGILVIYEQNIDSVSIIVFLIISSLFWFDATLTLLRRFKNKEKLTEAHKKHAYQRVVQYGFSHQKTVLLAIVVNIALFVLAYFSFTSKFALAFLSVTLVILYLIIKIVDKKKPFKRNNN